MRPRSETFDAACAEAHTVFASATLLSPSGEVVDLPIGEGSQVTLDGDAATRAALSLDIPIGDGELIPDAETDALAPYGSEITVESGITTPDGVTERIRLGVFGIDETRVSESVGGELVLQVEGLDRSSKVIDAVFEEPGTIAEGTNALAAAQAVITEGYPEATFDFVTSTVTLPLLGYEAGDDRWDFAHGCAEAAQCALYFDGDGVCVARPLSDTNDVDLVISEGEAGILTQADKSWSLEDACNRVVASGENASQDPVSGEAIDADVTSPTYYYGPFGKYTFSYSSEYITADEQAQAVAENILALRRGVSKQVGFGSLANPALEPYDTIHLKRERLKIDEVHVVASLVIPLDGGEMSGTTRLARAF